MELGKIGIGGARTLNARDPLEQEKMMMSEPPHQEPTDKDFTDTHIAALEADCKWMRREIERVGVALFTGANGYVGTEDDLKAVGQFVEGVCETMGKDQIENTRLRVIERESAAVIAMARSFANFPSWLEELEIALGSADLSKLTTQQKPDMESMLRASPSCGMDGCLWEEDSNSA